MTHESTWLWTLKREGGSAPEAAPPRRSITPVEAGSTSWGEENPLKRVHGRVCVDCGAKLRSYEPHRVRCSLHERFRHRAFLATANVWTLAEDTLRLTPTHSPVRKQLNIQAVALTVGLLSSPFGGFRGDLQAELEDILPVKPERITAYLTYLHVHKCLTHYMGIVWLKTLPYPDDPFGMYHEELRTQDDLSAERLVRLYEVC